MRNLLLATMVLLAGCGAGTSGDGGAAAPGNPPQPLPVLESLSIDPAGGALDVGGTIVLTVTGHFDDGSSAAINANWTISDPAVISLTATLGAASTIAAGLSAGTSDVTATVNAIHATVSLTVEEPFPADPGPAYAVSIFTGITRYPLGGGAPETIAPGGMGDAFVVDETGTGAYFIDGDGAGSSSIYWTDFATAGVVFIALLPPDDGGYFCLDFDGEGRLITINGMSNSVLRIDPETGAVSFVGTASGSTIITMGVGSEGGLYTCSLFDSGGNRVMRFDPGTGETSLWTLVSYSGIGGFVIPGGLGMNAENEVFLASFVEDVIFRCIDVNGDGDARDVDEAVRFATLPTGTYGVGDVYPNVLGVSAAAGGSVIVNVDLSATDASAGVYWLADRDGSGTCDGAGEVSLWSATNVNNLRYGNCIRAPR